MTISEKVAYLKGLAEGLDLDASQSNETKLISVMIGILEEISVELDRLGKTSDDLSETLDTISDDLNDVEDLIYGVDEDEDEEFIDVDCPNCGALMTISASDINDASVECPSCHERFALDFSDEEELDEDDDDQ